MNRTLLLYIFLLFFLSCKEKKNPVILPASVIKNPDSTTGGAGESTSENTDSTIYVLRGESELRNYSITVKSRFTLPKNLQYDSSYYFEGNYLFVRNKRTNTIDSIKLETDSYDLSRLEIEDLTDSLHFTSLFLSLTWQGDSDMEWSIFAGYHQAGLQSFFSLASVDSIYRKDKWTLAGFVADRDELVYNTEIDYPFTVSLKDYEVDIEDPPKQYIGYSTTVLAAFKGFRMLNQHDSTTYTIKKGTELVVDTLYRSANMVSLVIRDSIVVHVKLDNVKDKLQVNAAG